MTPEEHFDYERELLAEKDRQQKIALQRDEILTLLQDVEHSHESACRILNYSVVPGGLAKDLKQREMIWQVFYRRFTAIADWCNERQIDLVPLIDEQIERQQRETSLRSESLKPLVILKNIASGGSRNKSLELFRQCSGGLQIRPILEQLQGSIVESLHPQIPCNSLPTNVSHIERHTTTQTTVSDESHGVVNDPARSPKKKQRGRRPKVARDEKVKKQILSAWKRGKGVFKTKTQLAKALSVDVNVVELVIALDSKHRSDKKKKAR